MKKHEQIAIRYRLGLNHFADFEREAVYYVDKTPLIRQMIDEGRYCFLFRPRRFGKSLLVDTLQELFEGNEPLFRGLDIHPHWDWSVKHPVVRLTLDGTVSTPGSLEKNMLNQLHETVLAFDLESLPPVTDSPNRLRSILTRLHQATGQQVVVLVDEYDKPVLDVLEDDDKARANRDGLREIYSVLKSAQKHIRFVFVTGITMFSKTSFSSGLNNLDDISLYPPLASICGYTDQDLDTVFAPELEGLDRDTIREWYNGYSCWLGEDKLYNPHDILHLFRKRKFRTHWFRSGQPGYLYRMLLKREAGTMDLENLEVDEEDIISFELGSFSIEALLFQSGYLTIVRELEGEDGHRVIYQLSYPNLEIQRRFNKGFIRHLTGNGKMAEDTGRKLLRHLGENDFSAMQGQIQTFFSDIPYEWHQGGGLARYESWYASLLYTCFKTLEVAVTAEDSSSHGRSDMVMVHDRQVFVFEFRMLKENRSVEETLHAAIKQVRTKGYADKYRDRGEPVHLIGMVFDKTDRNLRDIRVEKF